MNTITAGTPKDRYELTVVRWANNSAAAEAAFGGAAELGTVSPLSS